MKKILILLFVVFATVGQAKTMREMLVAMPDSVVPYLNKNMRLELVELMDMHVTPEVKNSLAGVSKIDTLTADYLQLTLNKVTTLEMKLLARGENGDSLLCMIKTVAAPEKESEISFFSQQWEPLDLHGMFDGKDLGALTETLLAKPDTMSAERYQELKAMVEPRMVYATFSEIGNDVVFNLSLPLLVEEDKMAVKAILLQRKFKWNGITFKEI